MSRLLSVKGLLTFEIFCLRESSFVKYFILEFVTNEIKVNFLLSCLIKLRSYKELQIGLLWRQIVDYIELSESRAIFTTLSFFLEVIKPDVLFKQIT